MNTLPKKLTCGLALAGLLGLAVPAAAAPIPIKISTHASTSMALVRSLATMKEFIEHKSNGKYRVDIYEQFKLGTMENCYQGLQLGTLHFLVEAPSNLSNFIPLFQMFDLAYLFPDADVAEEVLNGPVGRKILDMATNRAVTPLCFVRYGYRTLWTNKKIESLADLKGTRVRASSSSVHMAVLKALGTNPIPMAGSEVYTSLQQGVIDAVDVDVTYAVLGKWYEVCKNAVLTEHTYLPQLVYTSTRWWNGLEPEDKALFEEALALYADTQRTNIRQDEADCFRAVRESGMSIYTPTPEERAQLEKATSDLYKEFPKIDGELLEEVKAEVRRVRESRL